VKKLYVDLFASDKRAGMQVEGDAVVKRHASRSPSACRVGWTAGCTTPHARDDAGLVHDEWALAGRSSGSGECDGTCTVLYCMLDKAKEWRRMEEVSE